MGDGDVRLTKEATARELPRNMTTILENGGGD
jgi:hypothetical protein